MSANWKENFLFDSPNQPNVSHLTVWEADVEETESDGTGAVRRSIRFVSENSDLSPEVFEFASKAIDLKARGEKLMKMALETVPIGSSNVGSETHRRIVGIRALFDAGTLPFMQRSEGKEPEPGDPTFPADHYVDTGAAPGLRAYPVLKTIAANDGSGSAQANRTEKGTRFFRGLFGLSCDHCCTNNRQAQVGRLL